MTTQHWESQAMRDHPPIDPLERAILPRRVARVDAVLAARLASVTVVCEDVFDPHNVGACLRTAEGHGLQDVHLVTQKHGFKGPGQVARSADQWLSLHRHASPDAAIAALHGAGFAIWVADLDGDAEIARLPVVGPVALVVGNEAEGVSAVMRDAADVRFVLPMHGMVQSYNLSVALGIALDHVVRARRAQLAERGEAGDLSSERQLALRDRWLEYGMRQASKVRAAMALDSAGDAAMLAAQAEARQHMLAATARARTSHALRLGASGGQAASASQVGHAGRGASPNGQER